MSNDLRYRVAYAIAQADGDPEGMEPASCDYEMADAVIAELGLHRNDEEDEYGGYKPTGRYRYVTEWTTDE